MKSRGCYSRLSFKKIIVATCVEAPASKLADVAGQSDRRPPVDALRYKQQKSLMFGCGVRCSHIIVGTVTATASLHLYSKIRLGQALLTIRAPAKARNF